MQVGISNNVGFGGMRSTPRFPQRTHSTPPIKVRGELFRNEADVDSTIAQGIQEAAAARRAAEATAAKPTTTGKKTSS